MFLLSLSDSAFTWFTSVAPNSIYTWAQLEQKFDEYFYSDDTELRLSHLTAVKQNHNERRRLLSHPEIFISECKPFFSRNSIFPHDFFY
jgi:hypothetical protein